MHACIDGWMHACMYVCMYVCMWQAYSGGRCEFTGLTRGFMALASEFLPVLPAVGADGLRLNPEPCLGFRV